MLHNLVIVVLSLLSIGLSGSVLIVLSPTIDYALHHECLGDNHSFQK